MTVTTSFSTLYTSRCSLVIRLDQNPAKLPFSGSGLPIPWKGVVLIDSKISLSLLRIAELPDFFHDSNSSLALSEKAISICHPGRS